MTQARKLHPLCGLMAAAGLVTVPVASLAQTAPAAAKPKEIQEVVVTANKVAAPASKTPIALSVLEGDDLQAAGVVDARALSDISPSLQISHTTGALNINIRGVQNLDSSEKGDPSNAFHIDGMYIGRPQAQFGSFLDVERIEVLRGPQGTLYGRNATGGAINVISNKPGSKFGGKLSLDIGNYSARRGEAALDVPVNDLLSLRVAAGVNKRDSYIKSATPVGLEDQDDRAGRLHALLKFSPKTSLLLTAETSKVNSNGFTPVPLSNFYSGTPKNGSPQFANDYLDAVALNPKGDAALTIPSTATYVRSTMRLLENNSVRAELKHDLGFAELTYQLGHLKTDGSWTFLGMFNGGDFYGQQPLFNSKQTSHELRLASSQAGPFTWVAGAYVFDEDVQAKVIYNTKFSPFFTFQLQYAPTAENRSRAVFGQTSYALSSDLKLVTGLRYTHDKKAVQDPFGGGGLTLPLSPFSRSDSYSKLTGKVGLEYNLSKATFLYGNLSTGYKAGGFNSDNNIPPYRPEVLKSLEVGAKTKLLNDRLQLNASAFAYDYSDLQLTSVVCSDPANPSNCNLQTTNAANAKIHGVELEGRFLATTADMVDFGVSLLRSRFGNYVPVNRPGNAPNVYVDWSGQQLDNTPASSVRLGYRHSFDLASGAVVEVGGSMRHTASYLMSSKGADYATRYEQAALTKFDANLTWRSADDKVSVQGYVRNITNKVGIVSLVPGQAQPTEPRTFGVRTTVSF